MKDLDVLWRFCAMQRQAKYFLTLAVTVTGALSARASHPVHLLVLELEFQVTIFQRHNAALSC